MLSNKNTKNANFLFIADMLKDLLAQELITEKEYARAKKYYMKQLIMMCVGMYIKRDHVISILVTLKNPSILRYHGKLKAKKYG